MAAKRKFILPLLILAVGIGIFALLKATRPTQPPVEIQERVWRVETVSAQPQRLAPTITLYGQVVTSSLVKAAAPGKGVVKRVPVREGQRVDAGQLLAELDERDFLPQLQQARAEVAELEARIASETLRYRNDIQSLEHDRELLKLAQIAVERAERLQQKQLGSESALDDARRALQQQKLNMAKRELDIADHPARLQALEAQLERANARLQDAELAHERSRIVAPFDAVVAAVNVTGGDRVREADVLLSFYPLDELEVRALIPAPYQAEIMRSLASGATLEAHGESVGVPFTLQLDRLAGEAGPSGADGFFHVLDNRDILRLNRQVVLHLQRAPQDNLVSLPYEALYGSNRIYVLREGRLQGVDVATVGMMMQAGEEKLLVRSEQLQAGDRIVVTHLPNAMTGLRAEAVQ